MAWMSPTVQTLWLIEIYVLTCILINTANDPTIFLKRDTNANDEYKSLIIEFTVNRLCIGIFMRVFNRKHYHNVKNNRRHIHVSVSSCYLLSCQ